MDLKVGDRVHCSARWFEVYGQGRPDRGGTVVGLPGHHEKEKNFVYVRWDGDDTPGEGTAYSKGFLELGEPTPRS